VSRPAAPLERVAWFEGSALLERDLERAIALESRMLALHVGVVHDTWGVALGLSVALSDDRREAIVGPGLAYACRGEPLAVTALRRVPAPVGGPAGDTVWDLVLAPAPPAEGAPCERVVACEGAALVAPVSLRWELAGAAAPVAGPPPPLAAGVRLGAEVPIARFVRAAPAGTLVGPDMRARRVARALVRPHVGFGVVPPATLSWAGTASASATVDTSAAGFNATPLYFAWPVGATAWPAGVVGPLASVAGATSHSFRLELRFGVRAGGPAASAGALAAGLRGLTVAWLGVESVAGCPPSVGLGHFLALGLTPSQITANWTAALGALGGLGV
jgi:hypothetical protein